MKAKKRSRTKGHGFKHRWCCGCDRFGRDYCVCRRRCFRREDWVKDCFNDLYCKKNNH